ncbi:hypothetical protein PINS_up003258 [Pythium insidiosum]|nr:hypothetical protein PINS_up003258 [Pythium insidiosum]
MVTAQDRAHASRQWRARHPKLAVLALEVIPDELRCRYPSKFCANQRAVKSTGTLHRFCEEHRRRANLNQKRWTQVRRSQQDVESVQESTDAPRGRAFIHASHDAQDASKRAMAEPAAQARRFDVDLSDDDIDSLLALLASDVAPRPGDSLRLSDVILK